MTQAETVEAAVSDSVPGTSAQSLSEPLEPS